MADDLIDPTNPFAVTTDQTDYAPGSTARITSTVDAGASVTFEVQHLAPDGTLSDDLSGTGVTWTVTDGGAGDLDGIVNGSISTSWKVGFDAAYQTLQLSAINLASGATASRIFTDAPVVPTSFAYVDTHIDLLTANTVDSSTGVIFGNAGSALASTAASGTGRYHTFLEVQNSPAEMGFNSGDNVLLDGKNSNNFNHDILLSQLIEVDSTGVPTSGGGYYAFKLDLHEPNSAPFLSLDGLQIWQSNSGTLDHTNVSLPSGGGIGAGDTEGVEPQFAFNAGVATKVYDLGNKSVLLNSLLTAGSGGGDDLVVLVPTTNFDSNLGDHVYLWSAFGFQGTDTDTGRWGADATFEEWGALTKTGGGGGQGPSASIALVKDTVCPDSPGTSVADGSLLAGSGVEWTYAVSNTGDADLQNIVVTDDGGNGIFGDGDDIHPDAVLGDGSTSADALHNIGDLNNDGILNSLETWSYTATGIAIDGAYANQASVTSDAIVADPDNPPSDLHPFGYATSAYSGIDPELEIDKITRSGADGNSDGLLDHSGDDTAFQLIAGSAVQWEYTVTNTGDVAFDEKDVSVTDTNSAGDTVTPVLDLTLSTGNGDKVLDPGESWVYLASGTVGLKDYTNTGTVTGPEITDDCDNSTTPSDSNDSGYGVAAPGVSIEKDIICPDDGDVLPADTAINLLKDGDGKVEYRVVVKNTGNVALNAPSITDSVLTLGAVVQTGGLGDHTDNVLDVDETWTYTVLAAWTEGGPNTNTATVKASFTDDAGNVWQAGDGAGLSDSAIYNGSDPHVTLTKLTNGSDGSNLLQGTAITWTYDVLNDGNISLAAPSVTDNPAQTITAITSGGYNTGDSNKDGIFDPNETWHFKATGVAGASAYSNTATATAAMLAPDGCGESTSASDTDDSSYTGHGATLAGLTKGYWATHLTLWDVVTADSGGSDLNPPPQYNWNGAGGITNSAVVTSGPASGRGAVSGANNGGGDSGLLMGDLNHDGKLTGDNSSPHLFFDLASAQTIANTSVSGDARLILASQAVAAQMNEYQDYVYDLAHGGIALGAGAGASPNGLIEEAVKWLSGQNFSSIANGVNWTKANVNSSTANDQNGIITLINDALGSDYTISGGAITLKKTPALSSSDAAWNTLISVTSYTPGTDSSNTSLASHGYKGGHVAGDYHTVVADGEGLKNALAAYNHGLAGGSGGFVVSTDGTLIGWQDSLGGSVYDVHNNTVDAFWDILADQNVLHPGSIGGVDLII